MEESNNSGEESMDQVQDAFANRLPPFEISGGPIVMGTNPCNWAIIENRWGSEEDITPTQVHIHNYYVKPTISSWYCQNIFRCYQR